MAKLDYKRLISVWERSESLDEVAKQFPEFTKKQLSSAASRLRKKGEALQKFGRVVRKVAKAIPQEPPTKAPKARVLDEDEVFVSLWNSGAPVGQIAQRFGLTNGYTLAVANSMRAEGYKLIHRSVSRPMEEIRQEQVREEKRTRRGKLEWFKRLVGIARRKVTTRALPE